jgi:replicative DNA helicase
MARALAAGEYFTAHALAVFDFMGADPAVEDAKAVHAWLKRNGKAQFTKRDVHRALSARFEKAGDVDPALEMLTGHGWIRPAGSAEPGKQGRRRPSPSFDVHPALLPEARTN